MDETIDTLQLVRENTSGLCVRLEDLLKRVGGESSKAALESLRHAVNQLDVDIEAASKEVMPSENDRGAIAEEEDQEAPV